MDRESALSFRSVFAMTGILVLLDQYVKWVASDCWRVPLAVIPRWLSLCYLENRGAAFGILQNRHGFFIAISLIAAIAIAVWLVRLIVKPNLQNRWLILALGCLLAGTIGNLIDRLLRGYVIDYISFTGFPTFNLSDILINIGVAGILFVLFFPARTSTD